MEKNQKQHIINQFIQQAGYTPDIDNPVTLNEKIQWLKLYYQDPLMTQCADKYAVRNYVSNVIGEDYLIPLIGVYDHQDEINFDSLPDQFVLKLNSGSGEVIICKDKKSLHFDDVKMKLQEWLKPETNHYYYSYEWSYKNIKPCIVCERYLEVSDDLLDYKFMCFNGKTKLMLVCSERNKGLKVDFYDLKWNRLPFTRACPNSDKIIQKPENFNKMIELAEKLSKPFPFVRVDFYEYNNMVYFGEMTFYPGNGMNRFKPLVWDYKLGEYLLLPAYPRVQLAGNLSISVALKDFNLYEKRQDSLTAKILRNYLKKCDLFVDASAQYGYHSILAADANREIKIVAFEPDEEIFRVLNENLAHNNIGPERVTCIRAAVLPGPGTPSLRKRGSPDTVGALHDSDAPSRHDASSTGLDGLLDQAESVRLFVRIDADGNEAETIKVFSPSFDRYDDITLLFEMDPQSLRRSGSGPTDIMDIMDAHGFSLYAIDDNEYRYYPLDVKENLAMMLARHAKSSFYILCVKKQKALNVVFFSHYMGLTGAERSLLDLLRGLSERGVLCTVVSPGQGPLLNELRESGYPAIVMPNPGGSMEYWQWVRWEGRDVQPGPEGRIPYTASALLNHVVPEVKKTAPDVIFTQTVVLPWGAICAGLLGIPHALSAREYGILDHNLTFDFGFEESIHALYESSDAVFCVTNDVKRVLFDPDTGNKALVVHSDIRLNQADDVPLGQGSFGSRESDFDAGVTVGIIGTICRGKGQMDLVSACAELYGKGMNVRCVLCGSVQEQDYLEELESIVSRSGFSGNYTRHDYTKDPYAVMRGIDVVVSCSRKEALGRTLFEAILMGKPIIYANAGGSAEVFTDGIHGLSYEAGDCKGLADRIIQTVEAKEETAKRVASARDYVKNNFNSDTYAGRIDQKLRAIKETGRRRNGGNAVIDLLQASGVNYFSRGRMLPKVCFSESGDGYAENQSVHHSWSYVLARTLKLVVRLKFLSAARLIVDAARYKR